MFLLLFYVTSLIASNRPQLKKKFQRTIIEYDPKLYLKFQSKNNNVLYPKLILQVSWVPVDLKF